MATNTGYFDKFPLLTYDINHGQYANYDVVTDIFFRVGMLKDVLKNIGSYYAYEIQDGETPDILAAKIYDDPGASWMILYANYIFDPQWDWPLESKSFQRYIVKKYGSIEAAKTGIHHYDKVVTRKIGDNETVTRFQVDKTKLTRNSMQVPYSYFEPYAESLGSEVDSINITIDSTLYTVDIDFDYSYRSGSLPITQDVRVYNFSDHTTTEVIKGETVSYFDYENDLNEQKRLIKVVKKEYYVPLMREFASMAFNARLTTFNTSAYIAQYINRLV